MKLTVDTNPANRGSPHANRNRPTVKLRLASLILTALLGSALVTWISRTTWERVNHLQQQFAGLNANDFYLAVDLQGGIERLNDTLLRYRLHGDDADYAEFQSELRHLVQWFDTNRAKAVTPLEREFFKQMSGSFDNYVADSTNLLTAKVAFLETKAAAFSDSYQRVVSQSQHLLKLCETFIADQNLGFNNFLQESNNALTTFQQMLKLSLALLLALILALAVLVYRGTIAPLRHRLSESHAIIERQEKLASLGELAAGVAHEIRNPLTAIKFRLYSLKKSLPAELADNEDAVVIGDEISRLERIVRDFLLFARPSEPELIAIPTQRILQEVCDLLRPQLKRASIELTLKPSHPAWVRADTQQIKQVLINLIQNSADSIGHGGEITLSAHDGTGRFVTLEVADNGNGIPPEVQERLFDPFFTTKEGGTGLGLPIAARIVEKHGGELRYETHPGHGTVFSVILPCVKGYEI